MKPQFQERHQDYVIDYTIDPRLASVAPGQLITNIELRTDPDAPFLLRGRAYRVKYDNLDSRTQVGLQNLSLRYSGPTADFRSAVPIPQGLQMPYGGLPTIRVLRTEFPKVKIIAMSGAGKFRLDMAGSIGANRTLAKPFSAEELTAAVAEVLGPATA